MDALAVAALVGAIGGQLTAMSALAVTLRSGSRDRQTTLKLGEGQHAHERALQHDERLFERKRDAYEALLAHVHNGSLSALQLSAAQSWYWSLRLT